MNQTDMSDEQRRPPSRIPVRFEEGGGGESPEANNDSGLTPEELGEASIYEDAGEMARRINRGGEQDTEEGRERADDADVAGTVSYGETFPSIVERGTVFGAQFHPEKSSRDGLALLRNFTGICAQVPA